MFLLGLWEDFGRHFGVSLKAFWEGMDLDLGLVWDAVERRDEDGG